MLKDTRVAPHAGAWIETLKTAQILPRSKVAPHAGAWIETATGFTVAAMVTVAPHAGAWIETQVPDHHSDSLDSRPSRRGVD